MGSKRSCPQVFTVSPPAESARPVRLAILDRDGTINEDAGYTFSPAELALTPWIVEAGHALDDLGFVLVVASNQSGVARGFFSDREVLAFNRALADSLGSQGVAIRQFLWCPHDSTDLCPNRKPGVGMIEWLQREWSADQTVFVGDAEVDFDAATAAGVVFLRAGPDLASAIRTMT